MIKVTRRDNESLDKLARRFHKKCDREGLTKDMKKNQYYEKPSEKKRRELRKREKDIAKGRL